MTGYGFLTRLNPWKKKPALHDEKAMGLSHPGEIAKLLQKNVAARSSVSVSWAGTDDNFNSAILEVEPDQRHLLLDELQPKTGHDLLTEGTVVAVHGQVSGIKFGFECPVVEIGGQSGIAFYRAALPTTIHYQQRRTDHRVDLGVSRHISVFLSEMDGRLLHGDVADLSRTGLRARVKVAVAASFTRGMHVPACTLRLPENITVSSEAEICHIESYGMTASIGARFIHLSKQNEREVERFMKKIEREHLRRRPNRK